LVWSNVLLIGPGLDENEKSTLLISKILKQYTGTCILDATAFSPLIDTDLDIDELPENCILTPHYGEFLRILGISSSEFHDNTIEILDDFSTELSGRILVLKGPNTIVLDGQGSKYFITNGNPLLSTAGTGDVLSGIILAYVSSGYSLLNSAIIGTYIHSSCSEHLYKKGYDNIIASDLIPIIPKMQSKLREYQNEF